jgi:hypothetical protein
MLPAMLATVCSYESFFGPFHPQTLGLTALVADVFGQAGEPDRARLLLEKVARDAARYLGTEHSVRLLALEKLRDLLLAQPDYEKAGAVQRELVECQVCRLGSDHSETLAARARLAGILLQNPAQDAGKSHGPALSPGTSGSALA